MLFENSSMIMFLKQKNISASSTALYIMFGLSFLFAIHLKYHVCVKETEEHKKYIKKVTENQQKIVSKADIYNAKALDYSLNKNFISLSSQEGNPIDSTILHDLMHGLKFKGFFVEFGCADGVTNSNTYTLEQLGWQGLCIEANLNLFNFAQKNRKHALNYLIGPEGNFTYIEMNGSCSQLSGIKEFYSYEFMQHYMHCKKAGMVTRESIIPSIQLDKILQMYGVDSVTYISADCEGCEYEFIRDFNFTYYDVQIFNYEDNTAARRHKSHIDNILASHNFQLYKEYGDRIFIRQSIFKKL
jgi:FkbM family methyltransferase